ncbi:TIGR03750 family conjugal transfer protein [Pseudomonas sp. LRF_L74]|uniref:TIGR03750 family conjugal transfer protein n=1 Tax=Pseudomonas sp. LRF_L74 TaxID=3369422 RepID=UPI003F624416
MSDAIQRLPDGTLAFLPERLNRDPDVLRGLTNDEMWAALAVGAAFGFVLGIPLAIVISIAMAPTTIIASMAVSLFTSGNLLRNFKRARPEMWLYRQVQWVLQSQLHIGHTLVTHSGPWTVRCTHRRLIEKAKP